MSTSEEAKAQLQAIKDANAGVRATENNKTKLLIELKKELYNWYKTNKELSQDMASEYMDLQKNAVNAVGNLERTIVGAKTSRSNAELAARAADIRSMRSAANKANPAFGLFMTAENATDTFTAMAGGAPTNDMASRKASAMLWAAKNLQPDDPRAAGFMELMRRKYGKIVVTEQSKAFQDNINALNAIQGSEAQKAEAALAVDGSLDRVIAGTASEADYDQARAVLGKAINKVDFSEDKFKLASDAELKALEDEGGNSTIAADLQKQIADLEEELFGSGSESLPEPTDEQETARLVASPEFREWAADHGLKLGYAEQDVIRDAAGNPILDDKGNTQPKRDANGHIAADMSTYEPGPDDEAAVNYAIQTIQGKAPTGPNKRESIAGLVKIRVEDPEGYEARHLAWSDGKYRTAKDPETGKDVYLPPEMEKAYSESARVEPIKIVQNPDGDGYILHPDGKVDYVNPDGSTVDITDAIKNDQQTKDNFAKDTAVGWTSLYKAGADGLAVPVTDPADYLGGEIDFKSDPEDFGGLSPQPRNRSELPSGMKIEITDRQPPDQTDIWVNRAPRDLVTDVGNRKKTVRSVDGTVYVWNEERQAYSKRAGQDNELQATSLSGGAMRGTKPEGMTAEEWAAEQSRLPKEERLSSAVAPEDKRSAKQRMAEDEANITNDEEKQKDMLNVPTIGGKRKPVDSEITKKGKERLNKFDLALSKFDENLNLKDPVAKATDVPAGTTRDDLDLDVVTKEIPMEIKPRKGATRPPTPDAEAEARAKKEQQDAVIKRLNRALERQKAEEQIKPIPGTRQLGGPLLDARDERRGRLKRKALEAQGNAEWENPGESEAAAAEAVDKEKENLKTWQGGRLDRPTNVMEINPQTGSAQKGVGFTSPEIRAAKKPIITSDVTNAAQSSAKTWASNPDDIRAVPKVVKDISATSGIDRATVRDMVIKAKKNNTNTQR